MKSATAASLRLGRDDITRHTVRVLHRGRGYQSTVSLLDVAGETVVVKDFAATPPLFRVLVAPFLVRREIAALRHLDGVAGVPRWRGTIDRYAFMMDYVEGTPVADFKPGELPTEVFPRVQQVIDRIHDRGVAHGDLKRRSNLILTPAGDIYLVDFAAAIIGRRPLHPFGNWLQRQVARVDDKSLPRLKKLVAPDLLTPDDWDKLNHPTTLEWLARRLLGR